MSHETNALAQIHRQVMWNRLISVVEEQAQTMIRTAFSTTVREAGDLSAGIFDLRGRMMAQAVTGTPGHVNSMAESVGHFLRKFPADAMQPGDHYITNDPWLGTGHLHDLTVVTPAFHNNHIVGLFASYAAHPHEPAELLDRVVSYSHPRRAIVFGSQSLFESGISMGYAATVVSILPSMEVLSRKAPVWCLPNACRHKAGMLLQPTNSSNPLKLLTQTGSKMCGAQKRTESKGYPTGW